MISLDTETTGLDLHHGAKPFLVTTCDEDDNQEWWEWEVQPHNREPIVIYEDLIEIQKVIEDADAIVLQNAKFDYAALQEVFLGKLKWDWGKVHDTLLAGHLLASNQPHDLTTMAVIYLGINLQPYEDALEKACNEARKTASNDYPDWRIAKKGLSEMPSAKQKVWKFDSWLPRRLCLEGVKGLLTGKLTQFQPDHPWWTVCSLYANSDSAATLALFKAQRRLLKKRGLWKIYLERLKVLPVACAIEERGITVSSKRRTELRERFSGVAEKCRRVCLNAADNEIEELPVNGVSNALRHVVFEKFGLVSNKKTPKGQPSMDKFVLDHWLETLPPRSKAYTFIKNLKAYRRRKTAIGYMDSYEKFWLPYYWAPPTKRGVNPKDWRVLYPSLNPTGTATLRFSSQGPNEQQISKQEDTNLRYCFGPGPGREWWSLDAKNIELRIPAYEAGEQEMIDLFERPNDPPYFGSYHLLVCHILRPKQWEECEQAGVSFKDRYITEYGWTKNFNFADQYGAVLKESGEGAADRAAHVHGAQKKVRGRLTKIAQLGQRMIAYAQKHGYVETMPDKTVDPKRGYPLLCSRSKWGRVLPTVPLNYHVQSTAAWWMMKAMIRCQAYLNKLPSHYMVMQVHDELVFDFPRRRFPADQREKENPWVFNLPIIRKIQKLMEQGGSDLGIPIPVSVEYHHNTWSEGVSV